MSSPTRRILGLRPVCENLLRAALTALGSSVEMVLPNVLLAEVCTRVDFVGEQLNSWTSLSKESIGIGLLLPSSTVPAEDFLAEVSVSLGEEGGVDSEWGEEGVDMEMEERVLLPPPLVLLSLSISARFNLKPSEGIPVGVCAPVPEEGARAGDDVVEWALRGVLEVVFVFELEFEEKKKREALPRETPRPLLPAVGWFWVLLCSMESRDCCLSKILGMDSLPFFLVDEDEDEEDFSEDDVVIFLLGYECQDNGTIGLGGRDREGRRERQRR